MQHNHVFLLLGSNLGDREKYLAQAVQFIEKEIGKVLIKSSLYNTAPWGEKNQDDFLNQALLLETSHSADNLLSAVLGIEKKIGRMRTKKWEERIIDIDILFYNSEIIETSGLTIPHPFLHERKFALTALAEIAPAFVHPLLQKKISELLLACNDTLEVIKHRG